MKINNIISVIILGILASFILMPTVEALPPFSGVIEYAHSTESGSIGVESVLFGNNIPVTINLSHQNEPHIAINPQNLNNIVAGANDYRLGSVWTGYYFSNDGGNAWGEGLINRTGNLSFAAAAGDPVLAFDGLGNAYYEGVAFNKTTNSSSIFVAKSTDGGGTFGDPVILAYSNNSAVSHDKPWIAVNTTNNNIYVTWTVFNTSVSINFTRSTDGGATWSSFIRVNDLSNNNNQASQVAVGPNGEVYVAWEDFNVNRILIDKSTNNGQTFGSDIQVQLITPLNGTLPNTSFRVYSFPTMAVDTSSGSNRGNIYIAWADNRTGDADILFTRSTNGGSSWSTPIRVNNDTSGNGKDQFFPAMSVDPNGKISIIFYDRRDDPSNHDINVYYAESTDGGLSFVLNKKINDYSINPDIGFNGSFIGDYIGIASGSNVVHNIWMDTRNGNQDIYTAKVSSEWQYNRTLIINGTTAGAQTNYQMKLTVYNSSGTDTPGNVYLGGNARSDFGDIRFTKSDGVTLLDYWIESYTSGVNATVWVEVDSIPATPNNTSIYLYYGNPSVASASSGTSTFVFFDDFPGTGLDTNKWTSSGSVSVSGGKVSLGTGVTVIYTGLNYNTSLVLRSKEKRYQTGSGGGETQSSFQDNTIMNSWDASNSVNGYSYNIPSRGFDLTTRKAGNWWDSGNNLRLFDGGASWHTGELTWSDNLTKWKWDDTVVGSTSDTAKIPVVSMRISFGTYSYLQELDWVAVRKYASPEPAWGT